MSSSVHFETHLRSRHAAMVTESQLPALMNVSQRPVETILVSSCPFCDDAETKILSANPHLEKGKILVDPTVFARHVAPHMEQLALFAIPRGSGDLDNDIATDRNSDIGSVSDHVKENRTMTNEPAEDGHVSRVPDEGEGSSTTSYTPSAVEEENPRLHKAAFEGLEAEVISLLDIGEDINSGGPTWGSALGAAVVGQHAGLARRLIERGADLSAPCGRYASTVQAAADLPDKAVERILFEASLEHERITFITNMRVELYSKSTSLDYIGATLKDLQERSPGLFEGLSDQCLQLSSVVKHISANDYLDNKRSHWFQSTRNAFRTFFRGVDHTCAFIHLIFDLLQLDNDKSIGEDTRRLLCPRLRLILRSHREMSLYSTLGQCLEFGIKLEPTLE